MVSHRFRTPGLPQLTEHALQGAPWQQIQAEAGARMALQLLTQRRGEWIEQTALHAMFGDHAFALSRNRLSTRVGVTQNDALERHAGKSTAEMVAPAHFKSTIARLEGLNVDASCRKEVNPGTG